MRGGADRAALLTPLFDDWECLPDFLAGVEASEAAVGQLHVVVVDDGSQTWLGPGRDLTLPLGGLSIVTLGCNLGHQRAIAVGLTHLAQSDHDGPVIVMDADGEDRPSAIGSLWEAHLANPGAIIVAQRRQRTEAVKFKLFYRVYRFLFRVLTGRRLDFGNFVLLPPEAVQRLVLMNELWNHFPAAVMRSRLPIVKVPIDRGTRYAGRSRMNFTALVNHGLAAVAAFIDAVFVRLLVLTGILLGVFAVAAVAVLGVRIWGTWGVPGWATTSLGIIVLGLLQLLGLLVVVTFLTLAQRSNASPPPASFASRYIARVGRLR